MSASDLEPFLPDWIEAAAEETISVDLGMLRERGRGAMALGSTLTQQEMSKPRR